MKLTGKDISLRPFRKSDIQDIIEYANDKTISKYTTIPYPYGKKDALFWLEKIKKEQKAKTAKQFAVVLRKEKKVIGGICLLKIEKQKYFNAELGYCLGKKYRNKGYTTQGCRLLVNYAFKKLKLNKVWIATGTKNKASNKLAKKLGAKLEGKLRKSYRIRRKFVDTYIYGILKSEWKGKK